LLRLVTGIYFVLHLPGYWLTAALWPGRHQLTGIERFGLSLGGSVVLVSLLALLLDRLGWGLRATPILTAELATSTLLASVAVWRRWRLPPVARYAAITSWNPRAWLAGVTLAERALLVPLLAVLGVVGAVTLWILAAPPAGSALTEFYLLGPDGRAEGYPRTTPPGSSLTVQVGIANREAGARRYLVEVWSVDRWDPARRERLAQSAPLVVAAGERREWPLTWQMSRPGLDQLVEVLLFAGDEAAPYRRLRLWLDVVSPTPAPAAAATLVPMGASADSELGDRAPTSRPLALVLTSVALDRASATEQIGESASPVAVAQPRLAEASADQPIEAGTSVGPFVAYWVRNHKLTPLWSRSDDGPEVVSFGETTSQFCAFLVVQPQDRSRLFVFNPASDNYLWLDAAAVGPVGVPTAAANNYTSGENCAGDRRG
jgi:uncharacterized membrane protein